MNAYKYIPHQIDKFHDSMMARHIHAHILSDEFLLNFGILEVDHMLIQIHDNLAPFDLFEHYEE